MAPPGMSTPGGEQAVAKDNLDKAKKLISDLEKKGVAISEAKGWLDQAQDMFRSGLFRTSIIYSGYALDAANELVQRIKDMVIKVTKVKARAIDMLGADNKNMPKIEELIAEMKIAINEGRLDDCQELISGVDEMLRGGASPYLSTTKVRTETIVKTAQPSRGYSSCPSCGNITESNWTQCKYCGQDLREEESAQQTGPSWQSGDGPLLVSDKEKEEDRTTDEDMQQMERTEKDLEKVDTDLDATDDQMVREVERTVDEKTSDDMREQETLEEQEERTEADLEKPPPLPPPLPPPIAPMPRKPVDEETSVDMDEQEAIEREMEKVETDLEKPVEVTPKPEVVPPVELPKEGPKQPEEPPKAEIVPPIEPPIQEVKPSEEPPKPEVPQEAPKVEAPPPKPPEVQKPPPPPAQGPKKFFIPPPPKLSFDDIKMPSFKSLSKQKTCPKCGEEVEPEFKSCPICKTPLG
jgi:hypothetical protein